MLLFRRVIVYLAIAGVGVSLYIGFWPVNAKVYGEPTYSCGSGFVHNNSNKWNVDSASLQYQRTATDTATGTPNEVCPDIVHNRRNLAVLVIVSSVVVGWLGFVFTSGWRSRMSRALFGAWPVRQWR